MSYIYIIIQVVFIILIGLTGPISPDNLFLFSGIIISILTIIWSVWSMKLSHLNIMPDLKHNIILVTSGPYKFIRHPMYASVLLTTLMLVINHLTLWRIVFWLVLFIDLHLKFNYEENLLLTKFPEYSEYQSKTKKLIPFIY